MPATCDSGAPRCHRRRVSARAVGPAPGTCTPLSNGRRRSTVQCVPRHSPTRRQAAHGWSTAPTPPCDAGLDAGPGVERRKCAHAEPDSKAGHAGDCMITKVTHTTTCGTKGLISLAQGHGSASLPHPPTASGRQRSGSGGTKNGLLSGSHAFDLIVIDLPCLSSTELAAASAPWRFWVSALALPPACDPIGRCHSSRRDHTWRPWPPQAVGLRLDSRPPRLTAWACSAARSQAPFAAAARQQRDRCSGAR